MRKSTQTLRYKLGSLAVITACLAMPTPQTQATPYASSLTNDTGTISFRLNEAADAVSVIYTNLSGDFVTNTIGALAAGPYTNAMGVPGAFSVKVVNSSPAGYLTGGSLKISEDTNATVAFNSPRGVAVNQNPASPYFGRVYVANSGAGSKGDGIYLLNADLTDAVGQGTTALTNGLNLGDANSPWRIELGPDDSLYVPSFTTDNGGIWVADPNMTAAQALLASTNRIGSSVVVDGSLGGANLTLYAMDAIDPGGINRIKMWDIGAGPIPSSLTVTNKDNQSVLAITGVTVDLTRGPDGKFYTCQRRSAGAEGGIFVVDPTVDVGGDGLWDVVYNSLDDSVLTYGETSDILFESGGVAISPDGTKMAVIRYSGSDTWIIPLVNGIPDLSGRQLIETGSVTAGRDVCFDAAGNLYTVSSGDGLLRVFSPGYDSEAVTSSSGTFSVTNIVPPVTVSVVNFVDAFEPSSDGQFQFTRSGGDISKPLSFTVDITGTATRGWDYNTNSIGYGSTVTLQFPSNQTSLDVTIPVINDLAYEETETVIFTLGPSTNYVPGFSPSATVNIFDDGDTLPELTLKARGLGFSELLPGRPAKYEITTPFPTFSDVSVNVDLSSGTAVSGVDFVGPSTVSVTITNGTTNAMFYVVPINNSALDGDRTVIAQLTTDAAYVNGQVSNATLTLRDDDLPVVPVLFEDDFDTNSSSLWIVNARNGDCESIFAYDYSVMGIPPAPNTTNGTTLGLRFRANLSLGVATGISASPIGVSGSDYRLRADVWINFNGPLPVNGTGSTEYFTAGIGVSENRTNTTASSSLPGASIMIGATGEGGSSGDYNLYVNGITQTAGSVYNAGSRDNGATGYAEFGELPCPAIQITNYPATQTEGLTLAGTMGFAWHDLMLTKVGTTYTWTIDGLTIATYDYATPTVGNNVSIGYQDVFTSLSANQDVSFAVFDNVRVESLAITPPLITSISLITGGTEVQIDFTADAADVPGDFTLQSTGDITTPFSDVAATISSLGGANFRAVRAVAGSAQYYRVKR